MTALPKRKPAPRPTMAKPEPRPVPSWEELSAPLDTSPPVILTPAALTAWAQLTDDQRAGRLADQDLVEEWHRDAVAATLGPLDAWMAQFTQLPPLPAMMP